MKKKVWIIILISALLSVPVYPGTLPEDHNPGNVSVKALPFSLGDVRLLDSPFTVNRDKTLAYLKFLDPDRMLHNFRKAAGIPSSAEPLKGWEEESCKLRGHSTGHYLLALSQAWASTADPVFRDRISTMVRGLAECQAELEKKGNPAGFLSAYSVEQFNRLEQLTPYPEIWAPYYTLHKILSGLIDAYRLAGDRKALQLAEGIGGWVRRQLGRVPHDRRQRMWATYIAGEFGGINESLADLARITGKEEYLEAAKLFNKESFLDFTRRNRDKLHGLHANQHIPQMTGYLKIFLNTGENQYLLPVIHFWDMTVNHHRYANGGVSEAEMFHSPDKFGSFITQKTCETCCAYNMLKLTRELFQLEPDAARMDYYERALYNQILASQDPEAPRTSVTYFMPMNPGAEKGYSSDYDDFTCCHGTGMENHTKYQESIYFRSPDHRILYLNLFIPSELHWKERGIRIRQETGYPLTGTSRITIRGNGNFEFRLRVPGWVRDGYFVRVNGIPQAGTPAPGSYLPLRRNWEDGDTLEIYMPFSPRIERLPDLPFIGAVMNGPLLLVGKNEGTDWIRLPLHEGNLEESLQAGDGPQRFTLFGIPMVPMYRAHHFRYHTYFLLDPVPDKKPDE